MLDELEEKHLRHLSHINREGRNTTKSVDPMYVNRNGESKFSSV
jgi:hypothetical protein